MTLQFLRAGGIHSFSSAITYDFLGSPAGFEYDVFQRGGGLYLEATNSGGPATIPAPGAAVLVAIGAVLLHRLQKQRIL